MTRRIFGSAEKRRYRLSGIFVCLFTLCLVFTSGCSKNGSEDSPAGNDSDNNVVTPLNIQQGDDDTDEDDVDGDGSGSDDPDAQSGSD